MVKSIVLLSVFCISSLTFAADISLVDNGDGSATIQLTSGEGENVRGLAIVVTSENPIGAVTPGDAQFNVFMEAACEEEVNDDGHTSGEASPAQDPAGKGPITLPGATSISLYMSKIDMTGAQAVVSAGTVDVATISTSGLVTVTIDELRGGIFGDAVTADPDGETFAFAYVVSDSPCPGDVTGTVTGFKKGGPPTFEDTFDITLWEGPNGSLDTTDLQALIFLLVENGLVISPVPAAAAAADVTATVTGYVRVAGPPLFHGEDYFDMGLWEGPNGTLDTTDLQALIFLLVENDLVYDCR